MSTLSLKFKINSKHRLDMSWLSNIKSDDVTKLKNTKINYGNKLCKVSELFIVSGNDHNEIKITNSNNRLDNIGHNLKAIPMLSLLPEEERPDRPGDEQMRQLL